MRCFLICAAGLIAASSYGGFPVAGKLPEDLMPQMKEAIEVALESSQAMQLRAFGEEEAEGRRVAAKSAVLPSFSTDVAFRGENEFGDAGENEFEERMVYNVTLSHPLYHWGTKRSEAQIGELLYDLEKVGTEAEKLKVVNDVRNGYMSLVLAKQRLQRSRLDLSEAREDLAIRRELVEAGSASESSLASLELDIERKELNLLRNESSWAHSLNSIAAGLAIAPMVLEGLVADGIPAFDVLDSVALIRLRGIVVEMSGARSDPKEGGVGLELERHRILMEVEKRRIQIEENSLKPKINAQLGLTSNALDLDGTRQEQEYAFLGLRVRWMIFDGFRKKGKTREALSRLARAEKVKVQTTERFVRELEHQIAQLEIAGRVLEIEEKVLASAKEQLDRTIEAIEDQRLPESEAKKSQRHYDNASLKAQGARKSYLQALCEIVMSLGLDER